MNIKCKKCEHTKAVVIDQGKPYCGDCYCKTYKLGKYDENEKQDIKDHRQDGDSLSNDSSIKFYL